MSEKLDQVIQKLVKTFAAKTEVFAAETWVIIAPEKFAAAAKAIHDEFGFNFLSCVTAVDYWPEENPRFHVVYRFTSLTQKLSLNVRVPLAAVASSIPTLEKFYHNANWQEREVYDMFGIKFEGHSDLRRLLMPADWIGHPQRKDYPLGYEEPQHSFNYDEIRARKPFATRE